MSALAGKGQPTGNQVDTAEQTLSAAGDAVQSTCRFPLAAASTSTPAGTTGGS